MNSRVINKNSQIAYDLLVNNLCRQKIDFRDLYIMSSTA